MLGGDGDDTLLGGLDDDYLYGMGGSDELLGGLGDDILVADVGSSTMDGEAGDDVYVLDYDYSGASTVQVIDDSEGAADKIYIKGLTSSNIGNVAFSKDADDLVINYNSAGTAIAIIADFFVGGKDSVERLEFDGDQFIDLTTLTIDGGGVVSYTLGTDSTQNTEDVIDVREASISASLQQQAAFWNNGFIQNLSETAYEEALRDQFVIEYYNGSEIVEYKRSRGSFGGHYKVYKLSQTDELNGTNEILKYEELAIGYNPADYDEVRDLTKVEITDSWLYRGDTVSFTVTDYWDIEDNFVTGYATTDYVNGPSFGAGLLESQTVYTSITNQNNADAAMRKDSTLFDSARTVETVTVGVTEIVSGGSDHLVGSWWDEVINGGSGDDALFGGDGDDTIGGDSGDDWLFGGDGEDDVDGDEGDDVIFGGDGDDNLNGGDGDDAIIGGGGDDNIYGEDGSDWIDAGEGADVIFGGDGDDIIYAGGGDDYAEGGEGLDVIYGQGGNDTIYGNEGIDYLYGQEGDDYVDGVEDEDHVYGGVGNDTLNGKGGDDFIYGGDGIDIISGDGGADYIDGGDGADILAYRTSAAAVTISLITATAAGGDAAGDIISNVEGVFGSDFADSITGDDLNNHLAGYIGQDIINGGIGNDFIYGGDDNDILNGGADRDYIFGDGGDDTQNGEDGDDFLYGSLGLDVINGGNGIDNVSYKFSTAGITIDLLNSTVSGGDAEGDTISSIENVYGSDFVDNIKGDDDRNYLYGKEGSDVIDGKDGDDFLYGQDGNDNISGKEGDDVIYGSDGIDTLMGGGGDDVIYGGDDKDYIYGNKGDDIIHGDLGNDIIDGGLDFDTITYYSSTDNLTIDLENNAANGTSIGFDFLTSIERVLAGEGDDNITGSSANDVIDGYLGDDMILGAAGDDELYGHEGEDTIYGGDGNDTINGGSDRDYLYGDAGDDIQNGDSGGDYLYGSLGADTLNGGTGTDYAYYRDSTSAITIDLLNGTASGGFAAGDTLIDIERIHASDFADNITGDNNDNQVFTRTGADNVSLLAGNDVAYAWADGATIDGGANADKIDYYLLGTNKSLTIDMVNGTVQNAGDSVFDSFTNFEDVKGSKGDDTIIGNSDTNNLYGYDGDDIIDGGAGIDSLFGNQGADVFVFSDLTHSTAAASDTIEDFNQGTDKINLSAFSFSSVSNFTISQAGGETIIDDNSSNFAFKLDGLYTLADTDFMFF